MTCPRLTSHETTDGLFCIYDRWNPRAYVRSSARVRLDRAR